MSFAVAQSSFNNITTNVTTMTYQYPSVVTAGNLLVCAAISNSGGTTTNTCTVSDSVNGAWTQITLVRENTSSDLALFLFYFPNTGAGQPTLTVTTNHASALYLHVAEVSGAATASPSDGSGIGQASTGTTMSASSFTTTQADFIYCAALPLNGISSTTGWTVLQSDSATTGMYSLFQVQGSAGAEVASFPLLGTTNWWLIAAAGFKPAAGGTVSHAPFLLLGVG